MPDKGLPVDTRSGRIRQKYFLYLLPGVCRSPKPLAPGQYSLHEEGFAPGGDSILPPSLYLLRQLPANGLLIP